MQFLLDDELLSGVHGAVTSLRPERAVRHVPADDEAAIVLTGVNHLLHLPGVPANDQVLAPAAVAALRDWAQPYAS